MRTIGRRQAENPLSPLSSFARPPLLRLAASNYGAGLLNDAYRAGPDNPGGYGAMLTMSPRRCCGIKLAIAKKRLGITRSLA